MKAGKTQLDVLTAKRRGKPFMCFDSGLLDFYGSYLRDFSLTRADLGISGK
jgi:hypothetical protein